MSDIEKLKSLIDELLADSKNGLVYCCMDTDSKVKIEGLYSYELVETFCFLYEKRPEVVTLLNEYTNDNAARFKFDRGKAYYTKSTLNVYYNNKPITIF